MARIHRLALAIICVAPLLISVVLTAELGASDGPPISITFEFSPAKSSYEPGETVLMNITAANGYLVGGSFSQPEQVTNISVHFGWMPPNVFASKEFSGQWLNPGQAQVFSIPILIPENATEQTYSYSFTVVYYAHSDVYGDIRYPWTSITYHDFVVAKDLGTNPNQNMLSWLPYVAIGALAIAVVAVVLVFYTRRGKAVPLGVATTSADLSALMGGQAQTGVMAYPVIHPMPGEGFPVEKGFIYLVKEKRPNISFAMYNEATRHGAKGMLVAREHPNRLKQMHEFEAAKILWLTRRVGMDHIDPTELSLLSLEISKFVESTAKSVVLLEGLEYIITQNDFESVLRFVNHLHDFVLAHDNAVIIVIDPRVLSTRELALLERSARIVEPAEKQNDAPPAPTEEAAE